MTRAPSDFPDRRRPQAARSRVRLLAYRLYRLGLQGDAVALGRALLLAAGLVVVGTVPLLGPTRHDYAVLGVLTLIMTLVLLASAVVPWKRLPSAATLVFPLLVWVGLGTIGSLGDGLGRPYVGLFVLCFTYTGLTHPARVSLWMLPPASVAYVAVNDGWSAALGVRLLVVGAVWVLVALLLADLTERQRVLTAALRRAAQIDVLTGLGNRRDLDLRMTDARPGDMVVICDLDHFKQLNDTLGHAAGDQVLADFGTLLGLTLRGEDYAARYGGEEFVLLLAGAAPQDAAVVLSRLRQQWALLQPGVTFSTGAAAVGAHPSAVAALSAADAALYAAKAGGRNCDRMAPVVLPAGPGVLRPG